MFCFAETTKDMTAAEILNYYRNLYYAEPQVTERGIVANAINDYITAQKSELAKANALIEQYEKEIDNGIETCNGCHAKYAEKIREVAREILQEVRQALLNMVLANSMGESYDIEKCFAEIEKKYTGGD